MVWEFIKVLRIEKKLHFVLQFIMEVKFLCHRNLLFSKNRQLLIPNFLFHLRNVDKISHVRKN